MTRAKSSQRSELTAFLAESSMAYISTFSSMCSYSMYMYIPTAVVGKEKWLQNVAEMTHAGPKRHKNLNRNDLKGTEITRVRIVFNLGYVRDSTSGTIGNFASGAIGAIGTIGDHRTVNGISSLNQQPMASMVPLVEQMVPLVPIIDQWTIYKTSYSLVHADMLFLSFDWKASFSLICFHHYAFIPIVSTLVLSTPSWTRGPWATLAHLSKQL